MTATSSRRFGSPPNEQQKAARKAAQDKWAKMTPEEKAAAKKGASAKKEADQKPLIGDFCTPRERGLLCPPRNATPAERKPTPAERQ